MSKIKSEKLLLLSYSPATNLPLLILNQLLTSQLSSRSLSISLVETIEADCKTGWIIREFLMGIKVESTVRVGQGFWVYGIQGLFKSGIRNIAA